jgi:hypothetical protein
MKNGAQRGLFLLTCAFLVHVMAFAMAEYYERQGVWVQTSDYKLEIYNSAEFEDINVIKNQIQNGQGNWDNPIIIPVSELELDLVTTYALVPLRALKKRYPQQLLYILRLAKKLGAWRLVDKLHNALGISGA